MNVQISGSVTASQGGIGIQNNDYSKNSGNAKELDKKTAEQDLSAMKKEFVVPDVIENAPKYVLEVKYESLAVEMGNALTPTQVKNPPIVTWKADTGKFYTLCMIDPDAPSRLTQKLREWHHWLVGNIKGSDIKTGEVLSEYIGAGPSSNSGWHRYVILVFEQPQQLTFDEKRLTKTSAEGRGKFCTRSFAKKYNLGDPIAGNFFRAEWDDYVPKLHEQLSEM